MTLEYLVQVILMALGNINGRILVSGENGEIFDITDQYKKKIATVESWI